MATPDPANPIGAPSDAVDRDRKRAHGSARRARNRSRHAHPAGPGRSTYFAVTGVLGFVLGVAALALAANAGGETVTLGASSSVFLVPGAVLAALGGGVVARAYRETRRRPR